MSRWLDAAREEPTTAAASVSTATAEPTGPSRPQGGVELVRRTDRLGRFNDWSSTHLWVLGTHGDAGENTVSELLTGASPASHEWPIRPADAPAARVLLVCRSSHKGLRSAQRAAVEFAAGTLPTVRVVGLVIVADAPGKRPKDLRDLATVVAGGFPEVWEIPWIEEYRRGIARPALPREAATTIQTISDHLSLTSPKKEEQQ